MLKLIDKKNTYYFKGNFEKGLEVFRESFDGANEITLDKFQVAAYMGKLYVVDIPETFNIEKGLKVISPIGKGCVVEYADTVALVKLKNEEKVFYIKDLTPARDPVEYYLDAVIKSQDLRTILDNRAKIHKTEIAKAFFSKNKPPEEVPDSSFVIKPPKPDVSLDPKVPKTPETPEPKGLKKLFSDAKHYAGRKWSDKTKSPPITEPQKMEYENKLKQAKQPIFDTESGTYQKTPETTLPAAHHSLVHIKMNPNSKSEVDKFHYVYQQGGKFINSPEYLDHEGKPAEAPDLLKQGIYVPGEKVSFQGKEFTVKSHINPVPHPDTNVPDYSKMLIKDEEGKTYSVPREMVKLTGHDFTNSKKVKLKNGEKKYHHDLKPGDEIEHMGRTHKVMHIGEKGYITQSQDDQKEASFHSSKEYDRNFRYWTYDKNKPAEKGDMIEFTHQGRKVTRPVEQISGEYAVVKVNKTDEPIKVHKDNYKFTGDKAHEAYRPINAKVPAEQGEGIDSQTVPNDNLEEFMNKIRESDETGASNNYGKRIKALDKFVGAEDKPHRSQKKENSHIHHLGIGDVQIETSEDPKTGDISQKIINPDIRVGGKTWEITDVNPENNTISRRDSKSDKKKSEEVPFDKFKKMLAIHQEEHNIRESKKTKGRGSDAISKPSKDELKSELAKHFVMHGIEKPEDITKEHNTENPELADKLHNTLSKFDKDNNKFKRGKDILEPEDYKEDSTDYKSNGNAELEKHFGKDWHKELGKEIEATKKDIKASEEYKIKAAETEAANKETKDKIAEVNQKNKELEEKPEKDYINNVYNNLPDISSKSLNSKLGIESAPHKISTKSGETPAEFHIVELDDTVNSHNPTDAHKNPDINNKHKIPFEKDPLFPPTGTQLRDYHSTNSEANSNRDHTLKVAEEHRPEESINLAPQGNTNTSIVDRKGVLMAGRGRNNSKKLLSPEQIQANKEQIKKLLPEAFPNMTTEQHQKLIEAIDNAKNPDLVRMAVHPSGEAYDFGKHTDDYKKLTKTLDEDVTKAKTERAEKAAIKSSLSTQDREELYKMIPRKTSLNRHIAEPKNALKIVDHLVKNNIVSSDEKPTLYDEKGLTDKGKRVINEIYKGGYFSEEGEKAIEKLPEAEKTKIQDFKNNHISTLLDLKTNDPYFDIGKDLEEVVKSKLAMKEQVPGQQKLIEDSPVVKGLKHILELPVEEQKQILDKFSTSIRNLGSELSGETLNFGEQSSAAKNIDKAKENFFKEYAKFEDYKNKVKIKNIKVGGSNAIKEGNIKQDSEPERPGIPQGGNIPGNESKPRQESSGQAGDSSSSGEKEGISKEPQVESKGQGSQKSLDNEPGEFKSEHKEPHLQKTAETIHNNLDSHIGDLPQEHHEAMQKELGKDYRKKLPDILSDYFHNGIKAIGKYSEKTIKALKHVAGKVLAASAIMFSLAHGVSCNAVDVKEPPKITKTMEIAKDIPKSLNDLSDYGKQIYTLERKSEKPFAIVDKENGKMHLLDKYGQLIKTMPVLTGAEKGDAENTSDPQSDSPKGGTTPYGKYEVTKKFGKESGYLEGGMHIDQILNDDSTKLLTNLAIHQIYPKEFEKRYKAMQTPSPLDNRMSWGCINVTKEDLNNYINPYFEIGSKVHVLPEKETDVNAPSYRDVPAKTEKSLFSKFATIFKKANTLEPEHPDNIPGLRENIARDTQKVLDQWQPDKNDYDEHYGHGGCCDDIAREIHKHLARHDYELREGGHEGDDHAYPIAIKNNKAYGVDIPPHHYEEGAGYKWRKIKDVKLQPHHINIWPISMEDIQE